MPNDPAVDMITKWYAKLVDLETPSAGTATVYRVLQDQAILMARVWLAMPGHGNLLASETPEAVLSDLVGFNILTDPNQIVASCNAITLAFNSYFTIGRRTFAALVGEQTLTTSELTRMFEQRRTDEVAEQNALLQAVVDWRKKLVEVAGDLSVPLSMAAVPAPAPAKPEPKLNLFQKLIMVEDKEAPKISSPVTAPAGNPSWQTVPVIDGTVEKDLALLGRIWDFLRGPKKVSPADVKNNLATYFKMDDAGLNAFVARIFKALNDQETQSNTILKTITTDFDRYNNSLMAGLELQSMLVDIANFFGFKIDAKAAAQGKPTK